MAASPSTYQCALAPEKAKMLRAKMVPNDAERCIVAYNIRRDPVLDWMGMVSSKKVIVLHKEQGYGFFSETS